MTDAVLVTGANGLVGRATVAQLAPERPVFALVRERSRAPVPKGVRVVEHDLRRGEDPVLPGVPETIVHLAQSPHFREFPERAMDVFEVNVGSTQRLLDYARRHGVRRFIYASSGGVYEPDEGPLGEDAPLRVAARPDHYMAGKRCGELLTEAYAGEMTVVILRFFFVYGPGQRDEMLVPRLVRSVARGEPIVLAGDGGIRINPVFADDAAAAVAAALRLNEHAVVNVAGPEILSIRDMAEAIGGWLGKQPFFEKRVGGGSGDLVADIERMCELLRRPAIGFRQGAGRLIEAVPI